MTRRWILVVAAALAQVPLAGQAPLGTLVIATRQDPSAPVPYIGPTTTGNGDVADQLFLRLAGLGPRSSTIGDNALEHTDTGMALQRLLPDAGPPGTPHFPAARRH